MTPEGRVKNKIKKILDKYKSNTYVYMPVPGGFGKPGLDFHCAISGNAFNIEAKVPGKKPTPRQEQTIQEMRQGGVTVFVIDGAQDQLDALDAWLADAMLDAGPPL